VKTMPTVARVLIIIQRREVVKLLWGGGGEVVVELRRLASSLSSMSRAEGEGSFSISSWEDRGCFSGSAAVSAEEAKEPARSRGGWSMVILGCGWWVVWIGVEMCVVEMSMGANK